MIRKKLSKLNRLLHSVFTKLTLISLLTWFLILFSIITVLFTSRDEESRPFHRNIDNYFHYIIKDLGSPPDTEKAQNLYETTGIHVSFAGKDSRWTTSERYPDTSDIEFRTFYNDSGLLIGREHGHHFLQKEVENGLFTFEYAGMFEQDSEKKRYRLLLLLILSAILLGCYFAIKRVLLPLKWLGTGVSEVADGNLAHRVPEKGNDELSELARSFNAMTIRLKQIMETKEHLLRDVSHELRSPLTRIRVALELLEDQELKGDIGEDIKQMEAMIAAILEAARASHDSSQLDKEHCDIEKILTRLALKYKNLPPGIHYTPPAGPVICNLNEDSIQTVFSNLIDNALKFSSKSSPAVEIRIDTIKDSARICITDHGMGIEEKELPFIFEPFYRVDKSRPHMVGGFGLGLSLCKEIVQAHDGTIEVKSTIDKGTEMVLTLPLVR